MSLYRTTKRKLIRKIRGEPVPPFPETPSVEEVAHLKEAVRYLYFEVSRLSSQVRILQASMNDSARRTQTKSSFEYQWDGLPESTNLLTNPDFKRTLRDLICRCTGLESEWFAGKSVLDAGCGNGRFTYGMSLLGAQVTAVDQSVSGVANAIAASEEIGASPTCVQADLLKPLDLEPNFDLVWSFGVLHHTGDTFRAYQNVSRLVKPGGHLFLMLYGEPRWSEKGDFYIHAEYGRMRQLTMNLTNQQKVEVIEREKPGQDVHGWFDAVSPMINDCYSFAEVESWLKQSGFVDIRRTSEAGNPNHEVIARRPE